MLKKYNIDSSISGAQIMIDDWYLENLVCPLDGSSLHMEDSCLVSTEGRKYPVVDGVPVMLVDQAEQTQHIARRSLQAAKEDRSERFYTETLGISRREKEKLRQLADEDGEVDPVVQVLVAATCGYAYKDAKFQLESYPIPELRLPETEGELLLDVGCNWGRWSIAAAEKGYQAVGIDPCLEAIRAANRVSRQLGLENRYIVADARFLPFPSATFDKVFSYSVLQHFSKPDAKTSFREASRTLNEGGVSFIQMPNAWGIRSIYHQLRRSSPPKDFDVRYWTVPELRSVAESATGDTTISVDCFFGLGLQKSDLDLMPPLARTATRISEVLRALSRAFTTLRYFADSVYVRARKK